MEILSYFSLVPLVALSMAGHFEIGVISALALSLTFAVVASKSGNLKTMDIVFPIFFTVCGITLLLPIAGTLEEYVGSLLWGVLATMALTSLVIGRPFTLQHAKRRTIEAVWDTPPFIAVNYLLTWIFAVVFTVNTVVSAIWGFHNLAVHVICFGLLFTAIASTAVLPKYYLPYYIRKRAARSTPKDLNTLPPKPVS